jgi:hypothetical protein
VHITGFLQVGNELKTGHLERFLEWNQVLFDSLVVYDDASSDGTREIIARHSDLLITGQFSQFKNEQFMRMQLLDEAKRHIPETEFFLWLDADELLLMSRIELECLIEDAVAKDFDSISFPLTNLWRSEAWFRTDSGFDNLRNIRIWKNTDEIAFEGKGGLHLAMHPMGLTKTYNQNLYKVLHFGFVSESHIIRKFQHYEKFGQRGKSLWRLINEADLTLKPIFETHNALGSRFSDFYTGAMLPKPDKLSLYDYFWKLRSSGFRYEDSATESKPLISLVCLIYKGLDWLEFQYSELLKLQSEFSPGLVEILFVANDASDEVLDYLKSNDIPFIIAPGKIDENEWYINSVYRAYNFGTKNARGSYVLLTNSDMSYSENFLSSLFQNSSPEIYKCSRLIESGRLKPSAHAVKKNFGKIPSRFKRRRFYKFSRRITANVSTEGGLYMPCLVSKEKFLELGGYPEGNLKNTSLERYLGGTLNLGDLAKLGEPCIPGDQAFIAKCRSLGIKHLTFDSAIAYHFQEGEKSESTSRINSRVKTGIAIANDHFTGINQESTLWNYLIDDLRRHGIRVREWRIVTARASFYFSLITRLFELPLPRMVFSNSSYSPRIVGKFRKFVLTQDLLGPGKLLKMQERTRSHADVEITNAEEFLLDNFEHTLQYLLPLPINKKWFEGHLSPKKDFPQNAIFVGAFNETKGWSKVKLFVQNHPEIFFTLVSKYADDAHSLDGEVGPNWQILRKVSDETLINHVDQSDFFILGSPYETQCLAAIECAARNLPVLMTPTGLLSKFPVESSKKIGDFEDDLEKGYSQLISSFELFSPRNELLKLGLDHDSLRDEWVRILKAELRNSFHVEKQRNFGKLKRMLPGNLKKWLRQIIKFFGY